MLKEVAGDILLTKAEALAHGVAPNDNFALRPCWTVFLNSLRDQGPERDAEGYGTVCRGEIDRVSVRK
jgi:hypothetical protein